MKFRFVGEEPSEFFGFKWFPGVEHDVTDAHAIKKLSNSVLFEVVGGELAPAPGMRWHQSADGVFEQVPIDDQPKNKKPGRKSQPVSDDGNDPNAS